MGLNERTFKASDAHKLEDPARRAWLPPDEVVTNVAAGAGDRIADIGAGIGYFAIPFARAVGETGHVFAVDVQPEMLDLLRGKLDAPDSPRNVQLVHGSATATGLEANACDVAFFANVWHELDGHDAVLDEVRRILRPEGRLVIVDWRPGVDQPPGPPIEHRIPLGHLQATLQQAGWKILRATPLERYHYMVVAASE